MLEEILKLSPEAKDSLLKDIFIIAFANFSYLSRQSDYAQGYYDATAFQKKKLRECFTNSLK